jgi:CsoR family transcriptional regulator, copper-sensing transcriptional repressor
MNTTRSKKSAKPESTRCGCAVGGRAIGPGGKAAGVDPAIKEANRRHLRRIEGQVRGIAAMIEEDRYCADIITQVAAVRESLRAVAHNLMRNHVKHCAASAVGQEGAGRTDVIDELMDLVERTSR